MSAQIIPLFRKKPGLSAEQIECDLFLALDHLPPDDMRALYDLLQLRVTRPEQYNSIRDILAMGAGRV